MYTKLKKSIIMIVFLFLGGSLISFIGLSKGYDIAVILSRPIGATSWTTSGEMMFACKFTPVLIGISLITLSIVFSTVLFIKWIGY